MDNMSVRPADLSDLDAVVALNHRLFHDDAGQRDPWTNLNWAREEGSDHFAHHINSNNSVVIVVELCGNIVGYLAGYVRGSSSLRPIRVAELESMFVSRDFRSQGVGAKLVDAFVKWSDEQQAQRISVTAYASNDGAIRFYQRLGFEARHLSLERPV